MRRRRRNPAVASRRTYFVRDRYLGDFQDFPSLKQAAKYAMRASDCDADDVGKCIFVERDESYVPLYQASPAAVHMISSYLHRNPMRRSKSRRNPNKGDKARHIRLAMMDVTSGWDYDLVSAEDSIADYEAEHHVNFTAEERAYIMTHAKPGSHMESRGNPRRQRTRRNCCNPLPYEHAARLIDPGEVIRGTYRRKNVKGGTIGLLFGKVQRFGPMKLASVRFRAAHFTPAQARSWMRDHRLKPILFEAASGARQAAWQQESVRAKRSAARGRKGRQRRRVA